MNMGDNTRLCTALIILVIGSLLALFPAFMRSSGPENSQLWLFSAAIAVLSLLVLSYICFSK